MIRFESEEPMESCQERISAGIDDRFGAHLYSWGPLVGSVKDDHLLLNKRTYRRVNSFRRVFDGKFRREKGKTILEGRFRLYRFITVILALIALFHSFVLFVVMYGVAKGEPLGIPFFTFLSFWCLFTVLGVLLYFLGLYYSKKEEKELIEFLETLLKTNAKIE